MADDKLGLHIDTDWKKQAQEEKKRLAEQQAAKAREPVAAVAPLASAAMPAGVASGRTGTARDKAALPPASFATLVQSILTQVLYYLGELEGRGGAAVSLDIAKHHIDTLNVLEQKTVNNLTPDEQRLLDTALYETRMRYVQVASQYL